MKTILIIISFFSAVVAVKAQCISYIETTKGWYNIYDQDGKMIKSLSSGLGELVGYSCSFYIIKQKTGFYITLKSATIIQYTIKGRFMSR